MDCVAPIGAAASLPSDPCPLPEAQAYCRNLAKLHYENFTVASWLLPRSLRQHFANVYAYCRTADDLADETGDTEASRRALDAWEERLHECYAGRAEHPVFVALAETVREFDIPVEPFADLLAAFRQDQRTTRYATFDELHAYCRHSANPVGRLVLHLGRCCNADTLPLSDAVCTGLQLINFCQDVARDWREQGRIYLPQESLAKHDCDEQDIHVYHASDAFRRVLADEVARAESFLHQGWPLVGMVTPALRIEVELFIRGGLAVAAAIRKVRYDVLTQRPTVGKFTKARLLTTAWFRQRLLRRL